MSVNSSPVRASTRKHAHALLLYDFAVTCMIASTNASTNASTIPPLTFADASASPNKGIGETAHNYSYVSLNL